jgi:pyridoxamine 5'-phosphate oxidase
MSIANIRINYTYGELSEADVVADPLVQFQTWFDQAVAAGVPEPNAMTVASVGSDGRPSARMLLLKGVDHGFVFYTNYTSRKASELDEQPFGALVFYWHALHRQVRIEGRIERVAPAEADAYYTSRPIGSQLGAWASKQSQVIPNRTILEQRVAELEQEYADRSIPRPPQWGGYRLLPDTIEFWQGRPSRLHDRLRYRLSDGLWVIERLSP